MSLRLKLILLLLVALMLPVALSQWLLLDNFTQKQRESQRQQLEQSLDATLELLQGIERDAAFNARLMAASGELDRYLKRSQYRLPEMTTYRALLKSWSVFLKHYAHYRQIAYVEKSGVAAVQFGLEQDVAPLDPGADAVFVASAARNAEHFIWYRPAAKPNRLNLLVAHGVAPLNAGDVVRRGNQAFSGYVVIGIEIDSQQLATAVSSAVAALQVLEIRLQDTVVVSTADRLTPAQQGELAASAERLRASRALNPALQVHAGMPPHRFDWLDPVLVRSGLLSLLQFVVAALIFFLIVHRWLVQPLQHALALTAQLGEGRWLGRNTFGRRDEMGALIQALHAMSERLHQTSLELEAKRDLAQQSDRLKTEFLANISHEIRTPVNVIVGVMNRLARFVTEPRQREYLESATTEAHRLVRQIEELIVLADLETKKHRLQIDEFYIPDLLQQVTAPVLRAAQARQLGFDALIDAGLNEVVSGDSQKLGRVLDVLLDNALKFTERGSIVLTARLLQTDGAFLLCEFAVQDTGCGIAPELIPALGQAFAQGDSSLVRRHGGLGLGLAIAEGFLALMSSRLQIESEPGQGSRFSFNLVLQRSPRVHLAG